jgi:hypothetical protein
LHQYVLCVCESPTMGLLASHLYVLITIWACNHMCICFMLQVTVTGKLAGNMGTIISTMPVCNSLVHVIDTVLIPAASLAAVPHPGSKDTPLAPSGATPLAPSGAVPNPTNVPILDVIGKFANSPLEAPMPAALSACPDTFVSAAQANGLTFLTQVMPKQPHHFTGQHVYCTQKHTCAH